MYRWYKYKEGFSASLVDYILRETGVKKGALLDPFAGVGTALFASANAGLDAVGIELLPIGYEGMKIRELCYKSDHQKLATKLDRWIIEEPWKRKRGGHVPQLTITRGAYPSKTERDLGRFIDAVKAERGNSLKQLLRFAAICVLEDISYTRKDGQYLRWDFRSGKRNGKNGFNKGRIVPFDEAIKAKLNEIRDDLSGISDLFSIPITREKVGQVKLIKGSVLREASALRARSFDAIITSPPYCNRYDYTRSYALELAALGVSDSGIKKLRQSMVTCTVENREKTDILELIGDKNLYKRATEAFEEERLLHEILNYLEERKQMKELNNTGIPKMVRNYFLEMSYVIFQCARLLKKKAPFVMINDNVRYAGVPIPVDLILSNIASKAGLDMEKIWVLPSGKGNSSQQMGKHGREELRKCVYLWRRS